jgi:hypothetical protein
MVDIAAPGDKMVSYDEKGDRVCMSGTSAAAPVVTFAAAVLGATGFTSPREIRRRLLATAEIDSGLAEKVAEGRVLDVTAAIDVFADQIWIDGATVPRRVWLRREDGNESRPLLLQLCQPSEALLSLSGGFIDVAALVSWRRTDAGSAEIWHRQNNQMSGMEGSCATVETTIAFRELGSDNVETVPLSRVNRIVPSALRAALPKAWSVAAQ